MPSRTSRSEARIKAVLQIIADNHTEGGVTKGRIQEITKELWGKQIGTGNLRHALLQYLETGAISCYTSGGLVKYYQGPQWGKAAKWLRAHGVEVEGGKPVVTKTPKEQPWEKIEREKLEAKKAEEEEARLHPDFHSCHTVFCNLWARHAGECQQHRRGYADSNNDWIIDEDGRRPWFPGWKGVVHED